MFDLLTAIWLGVIGACIGSFLNVVAYRWPRGLSVVWKPSHCPQCGRDIRWYDNVPVIGWLALRGRCRECGKPIPPRYAIVEAVMGVVFFALAYIAVLIPAAKPGGVSSIESSGSWNAVWNPNWLQLTRYAWYCFVASVVMLVTLMRIDLTITWKRVIGIIAAVALATAVVCQGI